MQATIATVEKCPDGFPDLGVWAVASWAHLGRAEEAAAAYRTFRRIATQMWEGSEPADEETLEAWVVDSLPICWPDGRLNLQKGLRLARDMAAEHA